MVNGVSSVQAAAQPTSLSASASSDETRPARKEIPSQTDAVELSEAAQEQIERSESGSIRTGLVERVRAEIAAGSYALDGKLDAAVERLHKELLERA